MSNEPFKDFALISNINSEMSHTHNDEAERAMLGAVFIDNTAMSEIIPLVKRNGLFRESHRYIFDAMLHLYEADEKIDVITLADRLHDVGVLNSVGGPNYLARLSNEVPSAANVASYAHVVRQKHTTRQAIDFGHQVDQWSKDLPYDEFIARFEQEALKIAEPVQQFNTRRGAELASEVYERWAAIESGAQEATGVLSGILALDDILGGAHGDQLITVAARPAMGKSSLANNWAVNAAKKGIPVGFISLEMSGAEVIGRAMCAEAVVNSRKLNNGTATMKEWERITKQLGLFDRYPFYCDDTSNLSVPQFQTLARDWVLRKGVQMILVDYLQLMSAPNARSRENEISAISRALKNVARDYHIPVIALAQLSRKLEERKDKRPMLSDIRESGAIEQDSDVIIFCYRDHVYNPKTHPSIAELIVAKNRRGPIGTAQAKWEGAYTRFTSATML